jgi:hypothetical protein
MVPNLCACSGVLDGRAGGSLNQHGRAGGRCDWHDGIQPHVRSVLDLLCIGLMRHGLRLTSSVNSRGNSGSICVHGGRADEIVDHRRWKRGEQQRLYSCYVRSDGNSPSVWSVHRGLCCGGNAWWFQPRKMYDRLRERGGKRGRGRRSDVACQRWYSRFPHPAQLAAAAPVQLPQAASAAGEADSVAFACDGSSKACRGGVLEWSCSAHCNARSATGERACFMDLRSSGLNGTLPTAIADLRCAGLLAYMYAHAPPRLFDASDVTRSSFVSVPEHNSASSQWRSKAACRRVSGNRIGGGLPVQYSALTGLQVWCATSIRFGAAFRVVRCCRSVLW